MRIFLIFLLFSTLCGCASQGYLRSVSAGQIGCAPNEITISNYESSGYPGVRSWSLIATCKGKDFICTQAGTGEHSSQINCSPRK